MFIIWFMAQGAGDVDVLLGAQVLEDAEPCNE